jgi:hypothetical protein
MAKTTLTDISQADIGRITASGGPTFKPLHGKFFRCNQLPTLGKITHRQCKAIRKMAGNTHF